MTGTFMVDHARAARSSPCDSNAPPASEACVHPTGMALS
jgi:hypothetical protein